MTQISRFKLKQPVLEKLFELFFEIVGKQSNKKGFNNIISELFSPVEKIMIAKRIAIIYLLLKDKDYITICHVLKVSTSTVSKYMYLKENSTALVPAFRNILLSDSLKLFMEELLSEILAPGVPHVDWSAAWKRRTEVERKKRDGF